jgi:putative ABC transport system ATP-binding protein
MTDYAVEAIDLSRVYPTGGGLRGLDLATAPGEVLAVVGPSGSGKSTLLYLLGGLDDPDSGSVRIAGVDWHHLRGAKRAAFRRTACGFVTQGQSLLPQATAAENVEVPLVLAGVAGAERRQRVEEILDRVGLAEHAAKLPDQLSGGQQQRVGLARALVNRPAVVLADEPTGSLDSATAEAIITLLIETAAALSATVVVVTHNPQVAARAHRIVALHSGWTATPQPAEEPDL